MPDTPSRAAQLGAIAFLLRPTYIATEVVTAAATTGGYSFVSDSVSKLGEVGCSEAYCSPRHEVMNGSFMGYGVLMAGGALLLAKPLGPWVTGLLVVSGVSSPMVAGTTSSVTVEARDAYGNRTPAYTGRANATFFESHGVDQSNALAFAMDLTPLAHDDTLDIVEYVTGFIDRFRADVAAKLRSRIGK